MISNGFEVPSKIIFHNLRRKKQKNSFFHKGRRFSKQFSVEQMGLRVQLFVLSLCIQVLMTTAVTDTRDSVDLQEVVKNWNKAPPNWVGSDPCGDRWDGIGCRNSRVISIKLPSVGLSGTLSGDISGLSELETLDLSYNTGLTGPLPSSIGNLRKLSNLILVGCRFTGPIPESIGFLTELIILSLDANRFTGRIPRSLGNLSKLYSLGLGNNQLTGTIPVSDKDSTGLDKLMNAQHFHIGMNQLTGTVPKGLFKSGMTLIHVLFEGNNLTGPLPESLGLVTTLEVVRFHRNFLDGTIPSNLNNLTNCNQMLLSHNRFSGLMPNLTGMIHLSYLDFSNNNFYASVVPSWFLTLPSLTTLVMENTNLEGEVPVSLFSCPTLHSLNLANNRLNGSLDIGMNPSDQLQLIDLQRNKIGAFTDRGGRIPNISLILASNPICMESRGEDKSYCTVHQTLSSYKTPTKNCLPQDCNHNQVSSPTCQCAYPYTGSLLFRVSSISDFRNSTPFKTLEIAMLQAFWSSQLPVNSIRLSNPHKDSLDYLNITLEVFPSVQDRFNRTGIMNVGFVMSDQTFKLPSMFGLFYFVGEQYVFFAELTNQSKPVSIGVIIGATTGGAIVLLLLIVAAVYVVRQKQRAQTAHDQNLFAHWDLNKSSDGVPQLKGAQCFSFNELNKYTNHFSDANDIGSGGYGKVYRGILPDGKLIAIKRAQQGSMQSGQQFKTEIELLSRVHHKNLVSLLGFCFEQDEQMLIYEYVPNGSLRDSLSGRSGIKLDWMRRLKIALGTARGLTYLHELANPSIIHRDVKSTNILLDETLNAKVADFGLCKALGDAERGHITTQVKGTMGYLDPEYYMTQQLTEKSDVYSFGVVMLELLTSRRPIERGNYILREIRTTMDKKKYLYNLYEILDPTIGSSITLEGFEKFVDLAMKCVEESRDDRPTMGEVVKEIENILQLAGMNPNAESTSNFAAYDEASEGFIKHPYGKDHKDFDYNGVFPPSNVEAH